MINEISDPRPAWMFVFDETLVVVALAIGAARSQDLQSKDMCHPENLVKFPGDSRMDICILSLLIFLNLAGIL